MFFSESLDIVKNETISPPISGRRHLPGENALGRNLSLSVLVYVWFGRKSIFSFVVAGDWMRLRSSRLAKNGSGLLDLLEKFH